MNKFLILALLAVTVCNGCRENEIENVIKPSQINMTVAPLPSGEMEIYLAGDGATTINWGDEKSDNIKLTYDMISYRHTYANSSNYAVNITCPYITGLAIYHCRIVNLDISKNTEINSLSCYSNQLTDLDLKNNILLTSLYCYSNQLTTLDISKNKALTSLNCDSNQVAALDLSQNPVLHLLSCNNNKLTNLDVSKNAALTSLYCDNNQLTALDVSKSTALTSLYCNNNKLTATALNALFQTLHNNNLLDAQGMPKDKVISIGGNPGANTCDRSIANGKGWRVI
ncbi:MAG: hypothetical protein LBH32_06010 [Dysgonamonadaceae bacterium]|jgi:hypothetical protein|nr:hypothetical protein [Dysgonamonadaceae bacterium]